ncbi:MAG: alpha/beta hydrolase [Kaiparowitsia implicata GSE-PSE-MK54-09C]|nr:alpha/beta hydrolase [Kaiparowitsia implicata GSE-PSE-MK54-09C]
MQQRAIALSSPVVPGAIEVSTNYVQQGQGDPPILLLHGFDSSVLEFRRLLPLLATQHETWAIDLLGFGFTERSPRLAITPDTIDAHLYSVWNTVIQRPVVLVGASMGGAAAIAFTLAHPDAVQQLILIGSAGYGVGPNLSRLFIQPLGLLATRFLSNPRVRQSISERAYFDPRLASPDAAACTNLHLANPGWAQALISFTQSGGYRSYKHQLHRIQVPTTIVWGRGDRILGTGDALHFHRAIPQSKLVWIENCGHVPHLEQPEKTQWGIQG